MKLNNLILALSFVGASSSAWALNCDDPQTNVEMKECARQDLEKADAALNTVYKKITQGLDKQINSGDEFDKNAYGEVKASLIAAQKAWLAFRDTNSLAIADVQYPGGGTGKGLEYLVRKKDMTETRTSELQADYLELK